MVIKF